MGSRGIRRRKPVHHLPKVSDRETPSPDDLIPPVMWPSKGSGFEADPVQPCGHGAAVLVGRPQGDRPVPTDQLPHLCGDDGPARGHRRRDRTRDGVALTRPADQDLLLCRPSCQASTGYAAHRRGPRDPRRLRRVGSVEFEGRPFSLGVPPVAGDGTGSADVELVGDLSPGVVVVAGGGDMVG